MHVAMVEIKKPGFGRLEAHQFHIVALPLHPAAEGEHGAVRGDAVRFAMEEKHGRQFLADHFRWAQGLCDDRAGETSGHVRLGSRIDERTQQYQSGGEMITFQCVF